MKFLTSRKGFTLIELLVVIGILAVLAAIAIPSVAGLIDRANVSADKTNSNEMTNAVERFASEYELYCQDIASGTLDINNLDSAQGRVYNVTGATTREEITELESNTGYNGIKINRDTKYPENADTLKAITDNYIKTSSSTFEPKQSDMHYWYSPACGTIVIAEPNSTIAQKNDLIISGKDAKGRELDDNAEEWIDVTVECEPLVLSTINTDLSTNTWEEVQKISKANKVAEVGWSIGDTKIVQINGQSKIATLIGINHDGFRTTTWQFLSSDGIGIHAMNTDNTNIGGWEKSEMRSWLNNEVYNSMSNKNCIKTVAKLTNNVGLNGKTVSATHDKLFLLSPRECNFNSPSWNTEFTNVFDSEGSPYAWFVNGGTLNDFHWLRSPQSTYDNIFFRYNQGTLYFNGSFGTINVRPAFVIG